MPSWFSRIHREFEAGNITRHWRDVLLELGRFRACRFGIWPSHATLATRARCSVRTVQRALEAAKGLGLVEWAARRVRAGWRSLRGSNRYVLKLPAGPVRTTGLRDRGVTYQEEKRAHERRSGSVFAQDRAAEASRDRQLMALGFAPLGVGGAI